LLSDKAILKFLIYLYILLQYYLFLPKDFVYNKNHHIKSLSDFFSQYIQ